MRALSWVSIDRFSVFPFGARLSYCDLIDSFGHVHVRRQLKSAMARRKPAPRLVTERSRDNPHRRLCVAVPGIDLRGALAARVTYGPYAKHKYNPIPYGLAPYAGSDVERTYCDAHSKFGLPDFHRIPKLLLRAVMLGLWSDQAKGEAPSLLWTIDDTGWIFELRITNAVQYQYHGYPLLQSDAFARQVLIRAREVAFADRAFPFKPDPEARSAIASAEVFYK